MNPSKLRRPSGGYLVIHLTPEVQNLIDQALAEDQTFSDPTTHSLIPHDLKGLASSGPRPSASWQAWTYPWPCSAGWTRSYVGRP